MFSLRNPSQPTPGARQTWRQRRGLGRSITNINLKIEERTKLNLVIVERVRSEQIKSKPGDSAKGSRGVEQILTWKQRKGFGRSRTNQNLEIAERVRTKQIKTRPGDNGEGQIGVELI